MDKTIYIVDDEESVIGALQNLLGSEGYRVSTFLSPSDFLNQTDYLTPSCLIVDLNMPGLDGFDVSLHLTERGFSIPTIFLTGYGTIPITVRAMKAGAFEFLTKPVMPDELLKVVAEALALSEKKRRGVAGKTRHHRALRVADAARERADAVRCARPAQQADCRGDGHQRNYGEGA
ncbi:response regulator [Pantoea tagorei]